jgi:hypothetical protein
MTGEPTEQRASAMFGAEHVGPFSTRQRLRRHRRPVHEAIRSHGTHVEKVRAALHTHKAG